MTRLIVTLLLLASLMLLVTQQEINEDNLESLASSTHQSGLNYKEQEEDSVYQPLTHENVKALLARAILRPKLLPKLKYVNPGKKVPSPTSIHRMKNFQLPKLHASHPNGSTSNNKGKLFSMSKFILSSKPLATEKIRLSLPDVSSMNELPLKTKHIQPTWLMSIKDLKSETCSTDVYNRTITSKGCRSIKIESKFCTGRCNSFFVPSPNADFQSCASCLPSDYHIMTIVLHCPMRKRGYKMKKVKMIRSCKCQSMMDCSPLRG